MVGKLSQHGDLPRFPQPAFWFGIGDAKGFRVCAKITSEIRRGGFGRARDANEEHIQAIRDERATKRAGKRTSQISELIFAQTLTPIGNRTQRTARVLCYLIITESRKQCILVWRPGLSQRSRISNAFEVASNLNAGQRTAKQSRYFPVRLPAQQRILFRLPVTASCGR